MFRLHELELVQHIIYHYHLPDICPIKNYPDFSLLWPPLKYLCLWEGLFHQLNHPFTMCHLHKFGLVFHLIHSSPSNDLYCIRLLQPIQKFWLLPYFIFRWCLCHYTRFLNVNTISPRNILHLLCHRSPTPRGKNSFLSIEHIRCYFFLTLQNSLYHLLVHFCYLFY